MAMVSGKASTMTATLVNGTKVEPMVTEFTLGLMEIVMKVSGPCV